jgi:mannitol-specific phosphotransferase system IIBC component
MAYQPPPPEEDLRDRSIGELVKTLADQTSTLVRQEIQLAKAEVTTQGKQIGKGAGLLVGAGIVALLAAGTLVAFLVMLLDGAMANWLAALIVGVVLVIVAAVLALAGRNRIRQATPPAQQTVETVKEDVQWAKTQTRSAKR